MRRAGDNLREVAERVLANRRQGLGDGVDLLARLVAARDQGSGAKMSDSLIIDNVVTFLMVGQETTAQALSSALYVSPCFRSGRSRFAMRCVASRAPGLWARTSSSSLAC